MHSLPTYMKITQPPYQAGQEGNAQFLETKNSRNAFRCIVIAVSWDAVRRDILPVLWNFLSCQNNPQRNFRYLFNKFYLSSNVHHKTIHIAC